MDFDAKFNPEALCPSELLLVLQSMVQLLLGYQKVQLTEEVFFPVLSTIMITLGDRDQDLVIYVATLMITTSTCSNRIKAIQI